MKLINKKTGNSIADFNETHFKIGVKAIAKEIVLQNLEKYDVVPTPIWGGTDRITGAFCPVEFSERPFQLVIPIELITSEVVNKITNTTYKQYSDTLSLIAPYFYNEKKKTINAFFRCLVASDGFTVVDNKVVYQNPDIELICIDFYEYIEKKGLIFKKTEK